jgi:Fic family protein
MRGTTVEGTWQYDPALYAPPRYRRACGYDAFVPETLAELPPIEREVAGAISAAEEAIRGLNAVAQPGLQPLARLLLRTESIASSKVEGMQVDARALARAEARSDAGEAIGGEALDVLANIDAMQLAVDEASAADALTRDHIFGTHRMLTERAVNADGMAGIVRTRQNWLGGNDFNPCGAAFVPPPPEYVDALLDDLVGFCNDETLPPLAQAAYAHAQFETIHPFDDGNGRTGRALVQVILRRRGLAPEYVPPISVVLAADKSSYIDGLIAFREGRENEWLHGFAAASARAAELAAAYLVQVQALQATWRERVQALGLRADAAVWRIVDVLPAHPIISQPVAVEATGRSRPAVQQGIDQLVDVGVLRPLSASRRNRRWEAEGLLDLSSDFEALRVARPPSDPEYMLSAKYAQALLSAYRDIVRTGEDLLPELQAAAERGRGSADLRPTAERWVARSLSWANDDSGPLSEQQRQKFHSAAVDPPPNYALLANVVAANLDALRDVRALIEP